MFAPLPRFPRRQPDSTGTEGSFVHEVQIEHRREPRSRKLELILAICWLLIIAKCVFIYWACHHYQDKIPFGPWWLIGPTLAFASLCTVVYWRRD